MQCPLRLAKPGRSFSQRGGCLIETATSFIDATVEARLNATIAQCFGSLRENDQNE